MDLKQTDRKLLGFLYHSNREPLTKIAKATGLSREQVDYRINKYIEEGIIRKFFTIFNYSKLGYPYFALLLLKFNKYGDLSSFKGNLGKNNHCISHGNILGKYDMFMNLVFKNERELNEYLAELINKDLSDYLLIKPYFAELYPLKFLKDKKEEKSFLLADYSGNEVKLEKTEIEILKLLNEDGRIRIIDIANKLNISNELVIYKLKKLYSNGIILGNRIQFDMKKLGYFYSGILLQINNMKKENVEKLKRFAKQHPFINSFSLSVAKPNCFMQFFHRTEEELRKGIEELKEAMKDENMELDIIFISDDEEKANGLPFLKEN